MAYHPEDNTMDIILNGIPTRRKVEGYYLKEDGDKRYLIKIYEYESVCFNLDGNPPEITSYKYPKEKNVNCS